MKLNLVTRIIFLLVFFSVAEAQTQSLILTVKGEESATKLVASMLEERDFLDSIDMIRSLNRTLQSLWSGSYLEASFDHLTCINDSCEVDIHVGPKYELVHLDAGNVSPSILQSIGFRESQMKGNVLSADLISGLMSDILTVYEDSGYPFAVAGLKNPTITDGQIHAELQVDKNKLFVYDEINKVGTAKVSSTFLQNYLDIKINEPYSNSKVLKIPDLINSSPFLEMRNRPTITFKADKAIVNLDLVDRKSSRFDFLIGILPQTEGGETSILITGELTADLYNKLERGEHFYLQFKRLRPETQELELAFNYPYILDSPFGFDTRFDLFRNANDYLELNLNGGLQYLITGVNALKFFVNFNSIRLLDIDTTLIRNQGALPNQLDINYNSAGLALHLENLDYKFNPRRGFHTDLSASAGLKNIKPNNEILAISGSDTDFEALYAELDEDIFQFQLMADFGYFFPIRNRATLFTQIRSGIKISGQEVFENEYFRIGGNKLLRGFDEETILGRFFSVFSLEYRLLIGQNSYIAGFFDYALINNDYRTEFKWDNPYGFGAGLNFETTAGIFGLSAAVGSQLNNPVDFGDIKVHFGYKSLF